MNTHKFTATFFALLFLFTIITPLPIHAAYTNSLTNDYESGLHQLDLDSAPVPSKLQMPESDITEFRHKVDQILQNKIQQKMHKTVFPPDVNNNSLFEQNTTTP